MTLISVSVFVTRSPENPMSFLSYQHTVSNSWCYRHRHSALPHTFVLQPNAWHNCRWCIMISLHHSSVSPSKTYKPPLEYITSRPELAPSNPQQNMFSQDLEARFAATSWRLLLSTTHHLSHAVPYLSPRQKLVRTCYKYLWFWKTDAFQQSHPVWNIWRKMAWRAFILMEVAFINWFQC